MIDKSAIPSLIKLLSGNPGTVIIPHLNPDGDAIGAALGLSHLLNKKDIKNNVVVPDSTPSFLNFLPGMDQVIVAKKDPDVANALIEKAELIFLLDFNEFKRTGELTEVVQDSVADKVMIDHHPDPKINPNEALIFSDTTYSSTCELVLEVMSLAGFENLFTKKMADCLMTGLITDTGSFSYNSSSPAFYRNVAKLLELGADKDLIIDAVYNKQSADRMRLMGYLLSNKMEIFKDERTAIISLNWSEMHRFNFRKGDSEGFVNIPLSIEGIELSVFISVRDDKTKLSFRSKGDFPANKVASDYFSGGGHLNAAGGSCDLSVEETVKYFKSLLPEIKKLILKDQN